MESGRNISGGNGGHSSGGSQKVGNVNVQIGDKEGIYAGSASNMARLFILCNVIWATPQRRTMGQRNCFEGFF